MVDLFQYQLERLTIYIGGEGYLKGAGVSQMKLKFVFVSHILLIS